MATATFTWKPDRGPQLTVAPTVSITKFGDGYEQRTAQGLNRAPESWGVSFTDKASATADILNFLKQRSGIEAFNWTTPAGLTGVFVCDTWSAASLGQGIMTVSATFRQVFEA